VGVLSLIFILRGALVGHECLDIEYYLNLGAWLSVIHHILGFGYSV
jgi:hypothetical protein